MVTSTDLNNGVSVASSGITQANQALNITRADLLPQNRPQGLSDIETRGPSSPLQFPSDRAKYYMNLDISKFSRVFNGTINFSKVNFQRTGGIILPLPQQMIDNHSVSYEEEQIGQFTGAAVEAGSSILALNGQSSMTNIFQSILSGATQVATNLVKGVTGVDPLKVAQAASGLAPNQFLTVLLKGPQYKKYEFSWKLSPRNEAESESIRKIIVTLNKSMAPGLTGLGAFFTFPEVFKVSFSPNAGVLYRFKPAVLENMTINYAPSGAPAFYSRTGAPDTVELRLQFLEIEFWLNDDPAWEGTPIPTAVQR